MAPRIAIPVPHSTDVDYARRALPQYETAIMASGGEPVQIDPDRDASEILALLEDCGGVLLPGSKADVDPSKFRQPRSPRTAAADPHRETIDSLLIQDAYKHRKPLLGICYGLQSLNVFRGGSLVQHIPDFLPEAVRTKVNHEAGKAVAIAHSVAIDADSQLAKIVADQEGSPSESGLFCIPVNSSHHQSADQIGEGLRVVARCPDDAIVEALEGTAADHFVLAVQWHPERSVGEDEASRAIFRALVGAAR